MSKEIEEILERLLTDRYITAHEAMLIMNECNHQTTVPYYIPGVVPNVYYTTWTPTPEVTCQTSKLND